MFKSAWLLFMTLCLTAPLVSLGQVFVVRAFNRHELDRKLHRSVRDRAVAEPTAREGRQSALINALSKVCSPQGVVSHGGDNRHSLFQMCFRRFDRNSDSDPFMRTGLRLV